VLNHPNIVKVLATLQEDHQQYIVMEYVGGGSLEEALKQQPQMPVQRVLQIALDLSDALTRAHRLNIIHRDLKPANILLSEDEMPRLTDFGVAYVLSEKRITETGTAVGTLDYLSPEALNGEEVDARSDIWAFGVMLFEMLAGRRPFDGDNLSSVVTAILLKPTPDLEALRPDVPTPLVDLIYRMLEKDRNQRIPSIRQVGLELEAILQGRDATPHQITIPEDVRRFEMTPPKTDVARHNLPAQTTPFVGRDDELAELARLLHHSDVRLVTVLAPGGMGKTRLALESAQRVANALSSPPALFENGVYFVPLAPLTAPDFITSAIAEAVKFSFYGTEDPKQQLLDFLREKHLLLVMDNFEHIIAGANLVADILQYAPHVRILATSRERLNLSGETVFTISGMDFPEWETPADALEYSAVKLFMQSARRAQPAFELTGDDLQYVARICRLVQGMPLGILLAAAWVEALSLSEIASEIERSLDFLESEMRDLPERHRSIRAVFEYSWNLLSEEERAIFSRLAVFRGGFARDAAMTIAGASLRNLTTLVNKSLVSREPSGRYQIHELLRQYAEEQLRADPQAFTFSGDSHCAYYTGFVSSKMPDLLGGRQREAVAEIDHELENIRVAWRWAVQHRNIDAIAKAIMPYPWFCQFRSLYAEGIAILENVQQVLLQVPSTPQVQICLAMDYMFAGWFYIRFGQLEKARNVLEKGITLYETLPIPLATQEPWTGLGLVESILGNYQKAAQLAEKGLRYNLGRNDPFSAATSYYVLASATFGEGNYEAAREYSQQAYHICEQRGDQWFRAYVLNDLGNIAMAQGNYAEAKQHFQASYQIRKDFDDPEGMAVALRHLGRIALLEEDFSEAKRLLEESATLYKDLGDRGGMAATLTSLGEVVGALGDDQAAKEHLLRALQLTAEAHLVPYSLSTLAGLAELLLQTGQPRRGIELLALVQQHPASPYDTRQRAQQLLERYRAQLAPSDFTAAVERGKARHLEPTVQELLTGLG
jgi:predicted ATPase/predicted negative regulator of RcsB-dependent stress response